MAAPRSRYATFLIILTLMIGLVPVSAFAQSDETAPTLTDSMDGETPLLTDEAPDPASTFYAYANGQYLIQALEPTHTGDLFSFVDAGPFANSRLAVDAAISDDGAHVAVAVAGQSDASSPTMQRTRGVIVMDLT